MSKAYIDRIHYKLRQDEVRDKVLKGELKEEDYDYAEVYQFLNLLRQDRNQENTKTCKEITEIE